MGLPQAQERGQHALQTMVAAMETERWLDRDIVDQCDFQRDWVKAGRMAPGTRMSEGLGQFYSVSSL